MSVGVGHSIRGFIERLHVEWTPPLPADESLTHRYLVIRTILFTGLFLLSGVIFVIRPLIGGVWILCTVSIGWATIQNGLMRETDVYQLGTARSSRCKQAISWYNAERAPLNGQTTLPSELLSIAFAILLPALIVSTAGIGFVSAVKFVSGTLSAAAIGELLSIWLIGLSRLTVKVGPFTGGLIFAYISLRRVLSRLGWVSYSK